MIENIFFDFDGVIADSVNVKTKAFKQLYFEYGDEIAAKVVQHHQRNGGMSRFEKFKYYHKEYLGITLDDNGLDALTSSFSKLVLQGVIDSPEVNGSHDFLRENKNKYKMFVITGTPTEESKQICKARGIFDCFIEILGSPQKKTHWSKYLLNKYKLSPNNTIFVGDAMADYKAAMDTELSFYLCESIDNIELFSNVTKIERFTDFTDFKIIINK